MTTYHYSATHSSGRVHLRKSNGRVYTHAIVTANFGGQSFAGRYDLAAKAHASAYKPSDWELVEAKLISKEEFAALTKASKQKFSATFMGKKFTKTLDGASAPFTCAVGTHYAAHVTRTYLTEEGKAATAKRIAEQKALSVEMQATWRGHNLAHNEMILAQGYWENVHTDQVYVHWCRSALEAHEYIERNHRTPAFRTAEYVEVVFA